MKGKKEEEKKIYLTARDRKLKKQIKGGTK